MEVFNYDYEEKETQEEIANIIRLQKRRLQKVYEKGVYYGFCITGPAYAFDALEPIIDAKTMEIHHGRHHAAYVANLNKAVENYPEWAEMSIEDVIIHLDKVPEAIRTAVRNNGGGHYNHSLFWKMMAPVRQDKTVRFSFGKDR